MKNEAFFDFPTNVEKELKSIGHKSWNESVKFWNKLKPTQGITSSLTCT